MKKTLAFISSSLSFLVLAPAVLAQDVNIGINKGVLKGVNPGNRPGGVLTQALTIIFVIAALAVLFYLILGAFQWITSGGDKDKVAKARSGIVNALIGFALLALAALIVQVVGQILNINPFDFNTLPSLNSPA